jgi:hypothetical protein
MEYGAKESSSRKLVWIEEQGIGGWGCSNCSWVFHPSNLPVGNSLNDLTTHAQRQLDKEFSSHNCAEYQRSKAAS